MGLFRTLLIIAVIYFIIRFITRILLPLLVGNYVNEKVSQAQQNYSRQERKRRDGEVTINYSSKKDKKFDGNEGEYVDFEEIKE